MWVMLDIQPDLLGDERLIARALAAGVHAQAEHNLAILECHPNTAPLYEHARAGTVRWQAEPQGDQYESIVSIPTIIRRGWGDCAHLAAWRVAECWRDDGERVAHCKVYWRLFCPICRATVEMGQRVCASGHRFPRPNRMFHAEVRKRDGSVEDPSRLMGM